MKRRFVRRPSATLFIATAALFLALGGTGYAAFRLAKNSVGTKQLKNGAVTTKKIKNGAVTDSKIAKNTITGDRINLSTLGTVPSANTANTASNATHASSADNATTVGGKAVRWFLLNPAGTIVAQSGGFTVDHAGNGAYVVNAGSPTLGHAYAASGGVASDPSFRGTAVAGPCAAASTEGISCSTMFPTGNDGNHILVATLNAANTAEEAHSVYVVMY
jgi:hypothetical protein